MRLYWIRHGQMQMRASRALDVALIERVFNQEEQRGLSPRGEREAERVGALLARTGVDALYASPLLRARETAEIATRSLGLPVHIHAEVAELRTGRLAPGSLGARLVERVTKAPVGERAKLAILGPMLVPLYYREWARGRTVGGETPQELSARIDAFVRMLRETHAPGARVAIVAHGYLILTMARTIRRGAADTLRILRSPYIPNGSVTEIVADPGGLRLVRFADSSHL